MLRQPYTRYERLYTYHLDLPHLPELDDPDLIGAWIEDGTAIFFFHRSKDELISDLCTKLGGSIIYQADLSYNEWEAGQEIGTFKVDDLTIAPVWEVGPADIRLDPSVVFGSGFHPSTRLCLEALLKYLKSPEIHLDKAIDLGTGTGLLAIAAAHLGVKQVTAVDNNRLACEVVVQNAIRNNVADSIEVKEMDLRKGSPDMDGTDLVIANLYKGLLEKILQDPSFWHARIYILSGFISGMEPDLLAAIPSKGLKFLERRRNDRWCLWVLYRTSK